MADDEKAGEDASTHSTDWEVVSLTASAYAAAPGPKAVDPLVESEDEINKEEHVDSASMFMSDHFIFPPYDHKQLMIEPDCSEIHYEAASQDLNPAAGLSQALKADDDNWKLNSVDGLHGIQFIDSGENLSDHGVEFGEGKVLEEFTMAGKEPDIYVDAPFSSFHTKSQAIMCDEKESDHHVSDISYHSPEHPLDGTNAAKLNDKYKVDKVDGTGIPCESWWKRHAMSVYNHTKEANTFWSVFVAAAVMGFVILGHQWHREKSQLQHLKWLTVSDESPRLMLGPFSRFKDILVGGHRQNLLIRGGSSSAH